MMSNVRFAFMLVFLWLLSACTAAPPDEVISVTRTRPSVTAVIEEPTIEPTATAETETETDAGLAVGLTAFTKQLQTAVINQDYAAMEALMADPIGAGPWRSQWQSLTPAQMVGQFQNSSLPPPLSVHFSDFSLEQISQMLGGQPLEEMLGPEANVIAVLHSGGWGQSTADEALLFVTEDDGRYAWSAFLYTNGRFVDANLETITAPAGLIYIIWGQGIYQVRANGFHRQIVDGEAVNLPNLKVSPDGRYAAYLTDERQLWLIDNSTGHREQLAVDNNLSPFLMWANNATLFTGVWLDPNEADGPNNGHLAFVNLDENGRPLHILDESRLSANRPALAADGQTIAFDVIPASATDKDTARLYHPDSGLTVFDPAVFNADTGLIDEFRYNPSWSPDGRLLTWFASSGERVGLQLYDLEAKTAVQIFDWDPARFGGGVPAPIWSPDGQWLALEIFANGPEGSGIWLFAADGSSQTLIDSQGHEPYWVNSTQLVYGVNDGPRLYDLTSAETFKLDLPAGSWVVGIIRNDATAGLHTGTPHLEYINEANGCGDIFVYKSNQGQSEYIVSWVSAGAFALSPEPLTLDLAENPETIIVSIDVYPDIITQLGEFPYCNDVAPMAEPQAVWRAISGMVTVTISTEAVDEPCAGEPYQATVLLEDVTFAFEGETTHLPSLSFDDVSVGWCAG